MEYLSLEAFQAINDNRFTTVTSEDDMRAFQVNITLENKNYTGTETTAYGYVEGMYAIVHVFGETTGPLLGTLGELGITKSALIRNFLFRIVAFLTHILLQKSKENILRFILAWHGISFYWKYDKRAEVSRRRGNNEKGVNLYYEKVLLKNVLRETFLFYKVAFLDTHSPAKVKRKYFTFHPCLAWNTYTLSDKDFSRFPRQESLSRF